MRILVTFAVKAEFSPWSSRHAFVPYEFENYERRRDYDLFKANIGPNEVTVLLTGMSKENAIEAMNSIPLDSQDICISSGLAGSLDEALQPGDVVAARTTQTLDGAPQVASDEFLFNLATSFTAKAVNVSLTSEKLVPTALEKDDLRGQGNIVEMESAHILAAAQQAHLPAVVVRAISDAADEDLPVDFGRVLDSHGHLKVGGLLKEVGLSPYRIPQLIQFGRQSRNAAKALADFLDRFLFALSQRSPVVVRPRSEEVRAV
jgi:adenosylhomocysteine nucleosidase